MNTVLVTGNTYPVKDQLRALGARWDPAARGWLVPVVSADRARALVGASALRNPKPAPKGRGTGCHCGSREGNPRGSDCERCQYDNE